MQSKTHYWRVSKMKLRFYYKYAGEEVEMLIRGKMVKLNKKEKKNENIFR